MLLTLLGVHCSTWYHAGYHLATTIATPAAYAPLPWAFAMLTWPGGILAFVIGTIVTWYNRCASWGSQRELSCCSNPTAL